MPPKKKKAAENLTPEQQGELDAMASILNKCIKRSEIFSAISGLESHELLRCKPLFCSFSAKPFFLPKIPLDQEAFNQQQQDQFNNFIQTFPVVYYTYGIRTILKGSIKGPIIMGFYLFYKIEENNFLPAKPFELVTEYEEEVPYFIETINEVIPLNSEKQIFVPDRKYRDEYGAMSSYDFFKQMKVVGDYLLSSKKW